MSTKKAAILIIWIIGTIAMLGLMILMLIDGYPQGLVMIFVITIYTWVCGQSLEDNKHDRS